MKKLTDAQKIEILKTIKKSIMTSDVVTDTLWMHSSNETVVEALDGLLINLGCNYDELEDEAETYAPEASQS